MGCCVMCCSPRRYGVLQLKTVPYKDGDEDKSFQMVQVRVRGGRVGSRQRGTRA